jgi:hypothetical protein
VEYLVELAEGHAASLVADLKPDKRPGRDRVLAANDDLHGGQIRAVRVVPPERRAHGVLDELEYDVVDVLGDVRECRVEGPVKLNLRVGAHAKHGPRPCQHHGQHADSNNGSLPSKRPRGFRWGH